MNIGFQKTFDPIVVSLCTERLRCVARTVQNEANSLWGFLNAVAFHLPPIIISWLDPFETNKAQRGKFFYWLAITGGPHLVRFLDKMI